ncbi:MAG: hypothetical protein AB1414_04510 [bacterium]
MIHFFNANNRKKGVNLMETIEYRGEVLSDGHLSCPQKVKKHLHLFNGSRVKVVISLLKQEKVTQANNDLEILNQNSEYLNQEAEDVLSYQVML